MGTAIAAMAALTAVGSLGCLLPPIQGMAREALRYGSLSCFGLVLWKLIDTPGANQVLEPRYGAFVAVGAALIALTSGAGVASAPLMRSRTVPGAVRGTRSRRCGSRPPAPPHRRPPLATRDA